MALGKRKHQQQEAWVATTELPRSPGHPFYKKLNQLLAEAGFDEWIETVCEPYYAETLGRPSIPPGTYFRMLLIGYFEGIASQRGIAWRCSDSRSLQEFLGYGPTDQTPDHSSLTRVHQRLPHQVHAEMFQFVLEIAISKKLVAGQTVGVDSTLLEANAAMKSIVRRDTGEDWKEYLRRLAAEAGLENPTDEDLRRFDKQRKDKSVPNDEWQAPHDPDSRIAKMKDGRTHLAYKAEHVVDLKSGVVLAAEIYTADQGDAETLADSVLAAQLNLDEAGSDTQIDEVAADKGYHKASTLELCDWLSWRTYIPEPKRKHASRWTDKPAEYERCVTNNRRRVKRAKSKQLQRWRSERVERGFAHVCETGGARRCWLRGQMTVAKRYLMQVAAHNLAIIMRKLFGVGTARSLQTSGRLLWTLDLAIWRRWCALRAIPVTYVAQSANVDHRSTVHPSLALAA